MKLPLGAVRVIPFVFGALAACFEPGAANCKTDADCSANAYCHMPTEVCVLRPTEAGPDETTSGEPPVEPGFELSFEPAAIELERGIQRKVLLRATRVGGMTGPIHVFLEHGPSFVQVSTVSFTPEESEKTVEWLATQDATLGPSELVLKAVSGELVRPVHVPLTIVPVAEVTVDFITPLATTYVNGALRLQVAVTGAKVDEVQLLKDGEEFQTLTEPFDYRWETKDEPEGSYKLQARVIHGDLAFFSPEREVWVDRTPPRVKTLTPENGSRFMRHRSPPWGPLRIEFDEEVTLPEPLSPAGVMTATHKGTDLLQSDSSALLDVFLRHEGKSRSIVTLGARVRPGSNAVTSGSLVVSIQLNASASRETEIHDRAGNALQLFPWEFVVCGRLC